MSYSELTFFKIFSGEKNVYGFSGVYEDFVKLVNTDEMLQYYDKIAKNYQLVPQRQKVQSLMEKIESEV